MLQMFYVDFNFDRNYYTREIALLKYKKPGHTVVDPAFR